MGGEEAGPPGDPLHSSSRCGAERHPRALAGLFQELCGSYLQGGGLSCIF